MFWKKKNKSDTLTTIEDAIRFAMERGISARGGYLTADTQIFCWKDKWENVENQLNALTNAAMKTRENARSYSILYPRGAAHHFNKKLREFISDENFKKSILSEFTEREVEVQKSRAMVEAVRRGKDTHPAFLALVEATSLKEIRNAESQLKGLDSRHF